MGYGPVLPSVLHRLVFKTRKKKADEHSEPEDFEQLAQDKAGDPMVMRRIKQIRKIIPRKRPVLNPCLTPGEQECAN